MNAGIGRRGDGPATGTYEEVIVNRNLGSVDRAIRAIAGLAIIGLGVAYQSWWGAIGVLPLLTAAIGWCPAYLPFGVRTCPAPRVEARS